MNAVLYLRYSSDKQNEQSIEGQKRVCEAFCEKNGYNILSIYIDRAKSASKDTEKRIQFQQMIKDSAKRRFEAVIVYKLDRFARDRYDNAIYKTRLKKNGVRVVSATENISTEPEGIILESVLEGMAEFYSRELSQKVARGMHETALKANYTGGGVPLGYKVEDKKLIIDERTADIVREAFSLYAAGATISDICSIFKEKGYKSTRGTAFTSHSFTRMLRNEKYIGTYFYREVKIENAIPAIVDKGIFEMVQKRLKKNASAPARGKASTDFLLSQKLFCGHCGAKMVGESGQGHNGHVYYYYKCATQKKSGDCDKKPVPKDEIERLVVLDTIAMLTPENIEKIADIASSKSVERLQRESIIPALNIELVGVKKAISNIVDAVEQGRASDALFNRLDKLEIKKKDLELEIDKQMDDFPILDADQVIYWLSKFKDGDINDPAFCKRLIDMLVNSVTLWDSPDGGKKITILYNLSPHEMHTFTISDSGDGGAPPQNNPKLFIYKNVFGQTKTH